jgi:hypothetical protein
MPEYEEMDELLDDDAEEPKKPKMSRDTMLLIFSAVYVFAGLLYLHFHNGFEYITAAYVLMEIVTTVGYGDVNFVAYWDGSKEESGNFGKLFMALYVMVGLTVIAGVITKVADNMREKAEQAFRKRMRKAQMMTQGLSEAEVKKQYGEKNELLFAFLAYLIMIAFGTIFYGTYENCSCSYGRTAVGDSCIDTAGYAVCAETSGITKSFVDSFYMSCITLTTVGFGDFAPVTQLGRAIGTVWMLVGVVVTANFIGEITQNFIEVEKERKNYSRITAKTFAEIDVDNSGSLSKYEFVSYVLLQYGLVQKEDLDEILEMYRQLDTSGDGAVTYEDLEAFTEHMKKPKKRGF